MKIFRLYNTNVDTTERHAMYVPDKQKHAKIFFW